MYRKYTDIFIIPNRTGVGNRSLPGPRGRTWVRWNERGGAQLRIDFKDLQQSWLPTTQKGLGEVFTRDTRSLTRQYEESVSQLKELKNTSIMEASTDTCLTLTADLQLQVLNLLNIEFLKELCSQSWYVFSRFMAFGASWCQWTMSGWYTMVYRVGDNCQPKFFQGIFTFCVFQKIHSAQFFTKHLFSFLAHYKPNR